jgi:RNA polymerase sigma-70 factor (ECF subfamily)
MAARDAADHEVARRGAQLMGRYCDGEAQAFHELYRWLAPRILGYLTGLCGDPATGEDLLQLTFLKLHTARAVYVRGANPLPWLYTIARTVCLDELRRRKRSRVQLAVGEEPLPEVAAHLTGLPEAQVPDEGTAAAAGAALGALATLPDSQRDALLLTKVHGRSLAEAAAITGSTVGAVKLRCHRGYVALRKVLGAHGAGDEAHP